MKYCLNCNEPIDNGFCPNCGQKTSIERISFKIFIREFIKLIVNLDSKFIRTFYALNTRPGKFSRYYLLGKRVKYLAPMKYFFFVMALNMAVTLLIQKPAFEVAKMSPEMFGRLHNQVIAITSNLTVLIFLIPYTFGLKLVDRQKEFSFIEYYCFLIFITTHSILLFIPLQLILSLLGFGLVDIIEGKVWVLIFSIYYFWGFYQLTSTNRRILKSIFSYILAIFFLMGSMLFIGGIFYLTKVI